MFSNLLKNKIEIEERVRKLQNNYINAIKLRKFDNKSEEQEDENLKLIDSNHEKRQIKEILEEKQNKLSEISTNYRSAIKSHEQLITSMKDQKEVTLEIYEIIKSTLTKLNIEIPNEFDIKNEKKIATFPRPEIKISTSENQWTSPFDKDYDKENFKV
ncbi:hypothetical protein PVAND_010584 [Polypedilum vanderplanki]|uniref:Uncharacterized protein n=1 Tax=Polypedilum vanderplanki TaxID=319348 RepID=A0A9J6CGE9_POLVA|nr:hypothetical protein PVAND_010584 [Polypedilum vanderplanki]